MTDLPPGGRPGEPLSQEEIDELLRGTDDPSAQSRERLYSEIDNAVDHFGGENPESGAEQYVTEPAQEPQAQTEPENPSEPVAISPEDARQYARLLDFYNSIRKLPIEHSDKFSLVSSVNVGPKSRVVIRTREIPFVSSIQRLYQGIYSKKHPVAVTKGKIKGKLEEYTQGRRKLWEEHILPRFEESGLEQATLEGQRVACRTHNNYLGSSVNVELPHASLTVSSGLDLLNYFVGNTIKATFRVL